MDCGRAERETSSTKGEESTTANWTRSGLTCLYLNARSLVNKMDVLFALNQTYKYDIIIVTESWMNDGISSSEIQLEGYDIFRGDRQICKRGGGVLLYVKAELNASNFIPKTCLLYTSPSPRD